MKRTITSLAAFLVVTLSLAGAFAKAKATLEGSVNINTASVEELMKLPGIGKSKAEAIVAYRESHPFTAVSELIEVRGIGPKMLEKLQNYLTIDGTTTLKEVEVAVTLQ